VSVDSKVTVAQMIRIEYSNDGEKLYLVFEVKDKTFKNKILKDLSQDIELILKGKELKE
jgi:hypothetical protein